MPVIVALINATATTTRIGVELGGWAADGPVIVYRSDGQTLVAARGANPGNVSGGAFFFWDYEAPFGVAVSYQAYNGSTLETSPPVTITATDVWLRAPGLPSLDQTVELISKPVMTRGRDSVTLRPIGQPEAVVLAGVRQSPTFDLAVRTYTDDQGDALVDLITQSLVLLVILPGIRESYQYVYVGDVPETPVVHYRPQNLTDLEDAGRWYEWSLPCTVTKAPVGGIVGDPTASYQAIVDEYATYQAVKDAKALYLDVLKGV